MAAAGAELDECDLCHALAGGAALDAAAHQRCAVPVCMPNGCPDVQRRSEQQGEEEHEHEVGRESALGWRWKGGHFQRTRGAEGVEGTLAGAERYKIQASLKPPIELYTVQLRSPARRARAPGCIAFTVVT